MNRTSVHFGDIVLALMSGAAAALSITSGAASALVGVMVAVAILPPIASFGIMLGMGNFTLAMSSSILVMVNLVCINLSAQIIFIVKKVTPRTPSEKYAAKNSILGNFLVTLVLMGLLLIAIYFIEDIKKMQGYVIEEGKSYSDYIIEDVS